LAHLQFVYFFENKCVVIVFKTFFFLYFQSEFSREGYEQWEQVKASPAPLTEAEEIHATAVCFCYYYLLLLSFVELKCSSF